MTWKKKKRMKDEVCPFHLSRKLDIVFLVSSHTLFAVYDIQFVLVSIHSYGKVCQKPLLSSLFTFIITRRIVQRTVLQQHVSSCKFRSLFPRRFHLTSSFQRQDQEPRAIFLFSILLLSNFFHSSHPSPKSPALRRG